MAKKKKTARTKASKKRSASGKKETHIQVFSKKFLALEKSRPPGHTQTFIVVCNIDGQLSDSSGNSSFTDLPQAKNLARNHRASNSTHRVSVLAEQ